jgi:hypothetical protein
MRHTIFLCVTLFLLSACAGSRATKETEKPANAGRILGLENLNEDFDPSTLVEPPIPIVPKMKEKANQANAGEEGAESVANIPKEIVGYRIQILQTEDAREAREFQQEAILRLDIDAYVSYDNPYYKVRIGDFPSRYEAEEFLTTLEGRGFKSAWIVRTLIVNPAYKAKEEQQGLN